MSINKTDSLIYGHYLNNALQRKFMWQLNLVNLKPHILSQFYSYYEISDVSRTLLKDKSNFLVVEITQLLLLYIYTNSTQQ